MRPRPLAPMWCADARVAQPGFTAPVLLPGDADRVLEFALTGNALIDSAADTVTITVTAPANSAPTAAAGADQRVASGAAVTLDGSASDPGNAGQSLTYAWTQTSGPNVVLSGKASPMPGPRPLAPMWCCRMPAWRSPPSPRRAVGCPRGAAHLHRAGASARGCGSGAGICAHRQ